MNITSKSQHLKLYFRLKNEECVIEKSVEAFIVNSKSLDAELWNNLKRDIDKSESERQILADELKEKIINMYGELKSVKSMIDVGNVEKIELGTFKRKLQCLWKKIQESKSLYNNSIDNLSGAQSNIDDDLNTIMRLIHKHKNMQYMDNYHHNVYVKALLEKEESPKKCDYDKVEDFSCLLAKTGHTGNWSEKDHLLYLKLRKKHKSIAALVLAIQARCPDLTKECIINHEAWYKTYLELREKQKLAVEEWRKRKQTEQVQKTSKEEEIRPKSANRLLNVPEHKKAEIEKKKEIVKNWKEQREKIRVAEEDSLRKRLKTKKEHKENRWRARAVHLKKLVAEHKSKIIEEKEPFKENNLTKLRDQQFLEKRKNIILSKKERVKKFELPIRSSLVKKHESTLLKETKNWQEKHKKSEFKDEKAIFYVKDLPQRMTVSWKSYENPGSNSCMRV